MECGSALRMVAVMGASVASQRRETARSVDWPRIDDLAADGVYLFGGGTHHSVAVERS